MKKSTLFVGFMLFAMFFGAGNLIFPPKLGLENQQYFLPSILGFIVTGVGLPLLGITVSSFYKGGYKQALNKISPYFSVLFLSAIYLSVGPFFAIPRTAATAYELALIPFTGGSDKLILFVFTLCYFSISFWLSLNPSKMVERIGSILTPVLLLAILALVIGAMFLPQPTIQTTITSDEYDYFFNGFVSGYLTMDALASIAFSVIVIMAIQTKGIKEKELVRQTAVAAMIAGAALALIYISLAWIGNKTQIDAETVQLLKEKNQDLGTYILNITTNKVFGRFGQSVLGLIVSLACLTTAIGLIVAVSEYFNEIYHKISYKTYTIIFTLIGFVISNQGLNFVIGKSVPVLSVLYPISITVILLLLINSLIALPVNAQRICIAFVTIISILSVADFRFIQNLPLKSYSMEWLPFAVAGLMIGWIPSVLSKRK